MPVYLGKDSDVTSVRVNNCSIVVWACATWLKKTEITVRQKSCSYEVAPSLPLKCCCLDCFFLYYFADNKKTSEVTEAVNEQGIERIKRPHNLSWKEIANIFVFLMKVKAYGQNNSSKQKSLKNICVEIHRYVSVYLHMHTRAHPHIMCTWKKFHVPRG